MPVHHSFILWNDNDDDHDRLFVTVARLRGLQPVVFAVLRAISPQLPYARLVLRIHHYANVPYTRLFVRSLARSLALISEETGHEKRTARWKSSASVVSLDGACRRRIAALRRVSRYSQQVRGWKSRFTRDDSFAPSCSPIASIAVSRIGRAYNNSCRARRGGCVYPR